MSCEWLLDEGSERTETKFTFPSAGKLCLHLIEGKIGDGYKIEKNILLCSAWRVSGVELHFGKLNQAPAPDARSCKIVITP